MKLYGERQRVHKDIVLDHEGKKQAFAEIIVFEHDDGRESAHVVLWPVWDTFTAEIKANVEVYLNDSYRDVTWNRLA